MRLVLLLVSFFTFAGCATSLKQVKSTSQNTYVYGYAEITGASKFQINLKDVETNKRFSYSKSWMNVPFMTKEILFAFNIEPGRWQLESVIASKGGQMVIPSANRYVFEVMDGKGNFMGKIKSTVNPFDAIINVDNSLKVEIKSEVDGLMGNEFPDFDSTSTTIINFTKE
jgi:hypothetical protein